MSLEDRTNESLSLSMHDDAKIFIDLDGDSSFTPGAWVNVYSDAEDQDFYFNMTMDEASLFRDRLNLILEGDWWKPQR